MTELTRRRILELAAASQAAGIAEAQRHAHEAVKSRSGAPGAFESLSAEKASELEALTSLIIPSGATPGAREAGVVYFIDKALATFDRDQREAYERGLRMVQARRAEMFPGSKNFASLRPNEQLRLAQAIENTAFFGMLRLHTIMGFLGRPEYGGNRAEVGWALIGFKE
jgi:gluconate 2-dehydrogenase gamma chain